MPAQRTESVSLAVLQPCVDAGVFQTGPPGESPLNWAGMQVQSDTFMLINQSVVVDMDVPIIPAVQTDTSGTTTIPRERPKMKPPINTSQLDRNTFFYVLFLTVIDCSDVFCTE